MFRDEDGELITDYHLIKNPLPNQIEGDSKLYQWFQIAAEVIVVAATVSSGSTVALNYLMNLSMNQLLSLVIKI